MSADPVRRRTRFLVLTLLAIEPGHGYEIAKRLENISGGLLRASTSSIYSLLRELKEEGLVEEDSIVEQGRLRKIYRLTRKGARELLDELEAFTAITSKIIQLAGQARHSLEKLAEGAREPCPPPGLIEGLKKLRQAVDSYIEELEKRARRCRANQ
ncbi:MAG: PadR family transcriptional regulator [Desulfurococcales archaeon]|nr:PadR family transcriptional regulator [Desulfurococcales archaeon]